MSWEKFDKDIAEFVKFINENDFAKDSVILAVKRGGFASSTALSNKLGIEVSTVTYQLRDGQDKYPKFLEPDLIDSAKKIIIPDDIYDTGKTIEDIVSSLVNVYGFSLDNIAGLFHYGSENLKNTKLKLYKVIEPNNGLWCVFPWE